MRTLIKPEFNTGSMADVAFLMLTFFMITTQISNERGLPLSLPGLAIQPPAAVNKRNLFIIHINSTDQYLVRGERRDDLNGLRDEIKEFIMNKGERTDFSDHPEKAVVSIKADRGTSHKAFVNALDEVQAAYYEIYAAQADISSDTFRKLNLLDNGERMIYEKGRKGIPMNISIAEPTRVVN